jgi:hypothetical protein
MTDILQKNLLKYSINVDIARYENGARETLNPEGRAHAHVVWDFFEVRLARCALHVCKKDTDVLDTVARKLGSNPQSAIVSQPALAIECLPSRVFLVHGRDQQVTLLATRRAARTNLLLKASLWTHLAVSLECAV